jgi:beta-lactamase regulating signal transducer with metallopeptidase domain
MTSLAWEFLKVYFQINILLGVSLVIFLKIKNISVSQTFKVGKILLIGSLVLPLILVLIPKQQLPAIHFSYLRPTAESRGTFGNKTDRTHFKQSSERHLLVPKSSQPWVYKFLDKIEGNETGNIFALTLFFGALILLTLKLLNLLSLNKLIHRGINFRKIGRVSITVSDEVSIPFSVLLGKRAHVVLPTHILLNNKDLKIACRHELQHHRQGDTFWALLLEVFVCFFYTNPVAYLWKKKITEFQELLCDEALIGHKKISSHNYASCLVRVAEAALGSRHIHVGTACMGSSTKNPIYFKSFLRRRIEMLKGYGGPRSSSRVGILTGTIAALLVVATAYGAEQTMRKNILEANPGKVVVDESIQKITEEILDDAVKSEGAKSGFAIVAEPNTGRILAVANIDTQNSKSGHWALAETIEAASIAKTLVVAEAINKGLTYRSENQSCENGSYKYGDHVYHDWKKEGWSSLSTEDTIAHSSDICSIKIGEKLGADGLKDMLEDFGFGPEGSAKTFPEAKSGQLPPEDDPEHPQLVPQVSAGYGFRITPLEMVQAYGAIANGGNLLKPQQANSDTIQVLRRVLSVQASDETKEILRQVVIKGTGKGHADSDIYTTAGKTATAYSPDLTDGENFGGKHIADLAAFIGFAPVSKPKVEVFVVVRSPKSKDGAHGASHAAPVFKRIVENVLKEMKVASDK